MVVVGMAAAKARAAETVVAVAGVMAVEVMVEAVTVAVVTGVVE
jgi:hypothetical protein